MQVLLRSALCVLALSATPTFAASFEVSAWVPYWHEGPATQRTQEKLDHLTEINPFSYTVESDGTLKDNVGMEEKAWQELFQEARKRKVRVIPTIMWADGDAIHRILSNPESRVKLEDDILALVTEHNFDGIDIDFEHKLYETRDYYSTFLKGLQMRFPKKWVMCTIESRTPLASQYDYPYPVGAGMYVNDYVAINRYCDRVRIMAYDQSTIDIKLNAAAGGAPYVPVADVRWVEKTLQEALKVIPKHKLHIGVPTYGYEYTLTPKTNGGYVYERVRAFNPPAAFELIIKYFPTVMRNSAGELSFVYTPEGSTKQHIVWWSDARAIEDKVKLAKRYGVRGISIFKIDGQEDSALWDILPKVR